MKLAQPVPEVQNFFISVVSIAMSEEDATSQYEKGVKKLFTAFSQKVDLKHAHVLLCLTFVRFRGRITREHDFLIMIHSLSCSR